MLIYNIALLAILSVLSAVLYSRLESYDRAARYASSEAFETAVKASCDMSTALEKTLYATDYGMCASLCGEVYADALAAEAAISALPFNTYELEHISGFVNTAGDYAYSLCAAAAGEGFSEEQSENLRALSAQAKSVSEKLLTMQRDVHNGTALIDDRQAHLRNIGEGGTRKLSEAMHELEDGFNAPDGFKYDGRYTCRDCGESGSLTEEEILALSARAAGVEELELKREYDYEGENARRLYSAGGMLIIADKCGLRTVSRSRLVAEENVSEEQAQKAAEEYLAAQGFENLVLRAAQHQGGCIAFRYATVSGDAVCEDNCVGIAVALDNGEIYALNAENYCPDEVSAEWNVTEEAARKKLPQGIEVQSGERVIIRSAGGKNIACYKYVCTGEDGRSVGIYVNAADGRQYKIEF